MAQRRKELGKNFDMKKLQKEYAKISESTRDHLEKVVAEDQEKYNEAIFHYTNAINNLPKQRYSVSSKIPAKPKKPSTTFFLFLNEHRNAYAQKYKNETQ